MSAESIYQFRITLLYIKPAIWRRIQVPASYSFWDLHVAIQDSMGWLDYHLHEFKMKQPGSDKIVEIGIPDPDSGFEILPEGEVAITDYFTEPGVEAEYNYDFGEYWEHKVVLEEILPKDDSVKYPVCVAGERACPPEDCGGEGGYDELVSVLKSPGTEEYKDMVSWLKGHAKNYHPYRPDHFDPKEVKFDDPALRFRMAYGDQD
jgi:hypothetical protein